MIELPKLSPVVVLAPTHVVGAFTCGDAEIDDFLRTRARIEQAIGVSQVYVSANERKRSRGVFLRFPQ